MKLLDFILILFFIFPFFTNQNPTPIGLKDELIQKFLRSKEAIAARNSQNQTIIYLNPYCESFDCPSYFKDYKQEIVFYALEDIFMRGLSQYLIITKIDEQKGEIITKRPGFKNGTVIRNNNNKH